MAIYFNVNECKWYRQSPAGEEAYDAWIALEDDPSTSVAKFNVARQSFRDSLDHGVKLAEVGVDLTDDVIDVLIAESERLRWRGRKQPDEFMLSWIRRGFRVAQATQRQLREMARRKTREMREANYLPVATR